MQHLPPEAPAAAAWPAGYHLLRDHTRPGAAERLVEAERGGQRVALRLSPQDIGPELRSELAVLGAVRHPGLAGLLDHGALPGGGSFVAREWIAGPDLRQWAAGRSAEDVGRAVARLCLALHALHERGFVHGDLKAANVFVVEAPDGPRPVLSDFGLARAVGAGGGATGSLFHLAPELLLGGDVGPASDLFALGVLLHELWIGRRPSARDFYGRFPANDFFAATATRADELPSWARDVVAALLERVPQRRPASAAEVAATLAGRLGLADLIRERQPELRWTALEGRESWLRDWEERLSATPPPTLRWLYFAADEDPRELVGELALRAVLRGARAQRLDAARLAACARDERALAQLCAEHAGVLLFVALETGEPWPARAAEVLAQAIAASTPPQRPAGLIVGARARALDSNLAWAVEELPQVDESNALAFARARLDADAPRALAFARALSSAAAGSATRADRALQRAISSGWIVRGEAAPRLRSGAPPVKLLDDGGAPPDRDTDEGQVWAALHVAGADAGLASVRELALLAPERFQAALEALRARGLLALERDRARTTLRALVQLDPSGLAAEPRWAQLHARRAQQLAAEGAPSARTLPHALRAGLASVSDVTTECERLRDRGQPELALQLCDAALAQRAEAKLTPEPELHAERALAWSAMGDGDRALEALAALPSAGAADPHAAALAERARGQVAQLLHEPSKALEHFERARELDPDDGGLAALAKVRLLFELNRDREVLALCGELRAQGLQQRALPRAWAMLLVTEAVSLFRVGEVSRAKELLEAQLADARATGDVGREAGVRINLATVERRAGSLARALEHFERALELYEGAGLLPGLAQARAQLGGTLRELGELARAQPLLQGALALRERLGDLVGAATVRGMLGLLLADRGHARAALEELERAARELRASGRSRVAVMLEARALETRARLGDRSQLAAGASSEVERAAEGDPRILLSRARALLLAGDSRAALEHVQRADALARSLNLTALRQEAQFLLARLTGAGAPPPAADSASLADEDARLLELLARAPFDAPRALHMAEQLAARGRDDRAARLLLALAARTGDGNSGRAGQRAEELIATCTRGTSPSEEANLRRALLSLPDPWPEDFVAHERRRAPPEDDEMEVTGLLEINHRLLAQEDLRSLLGTIVEQALAVSGAQRGFLILEEEGELKVDTALDSRRGDIDTPDVEVSGSVLREALERMKPVRVSNAVDDPQLGVAPSVIQLELRSILCVPFQVQRGLRGVIYVDHRLREGAFDARAQRMLALLADQAALAILQVRRLEEIRRLNRELGKLVARKESDLKTATEALRRLNAPAPAGGLVGDSPPMREVRRLIERAAGSKLAVLVTGPSGSGKELAARALHELGARREGPFIGENCAALPASLIEAELFGARKGAYTGADRDREGLFERANGGTLFLDELGELPLELQAKLLRVLETGQVRRLGDDRVRTVDVRLVAATHRDLAREVAEGRFRADLYYRLDGLRVVLPPLSARAEDIPALVDHFLRLQAEPGCAPRAVSPAVLARLCRRAWPGNVRELFNELARLCVMTEGDLDDPALVREPETTAEPAHAATRGPNGTVKTLELLEREAILHALEVSGNDKRKAAELLGISRAKVYQRLKDWGLTGGERGDPE